MKMALTKNDFTGRVNYATVYGPGLHFIYPWYSAIVFDKTAKSIAFETRIFTTDKMEVKVAFELYYFLK
jgi:hypothetical protein